MTPDSDPLDSIIRTPDKLKGTISTTLIFPITISMVPD